MKIQDFQKMVSVSPSAVILLEGRRGISEAEALAARNYGEFLARRFPARIVISSLRAATPGRDLPSRSSREAPPPVEQWLTCSATPNFLAAWFKIAKKEHCMISSVMSFLTSGDCAGYKCFRLSAEVAGWSERCCFGSLPGFD